MFDPEVLDIDESLLTGKFLSGATFLAAVSLGLGVPSKASIVHSVNDAFKTILAISLETDYKIARVAAFEEFLKNPGAFAVAAPAGGAAASGAAAAAAAPKEEEKKEEEEEEVGGAGGLFGGDDDDW